MVETSITTHIPPDASPDRLFMLISHMHEQGITFESASSLMDFANELGFGRRSELHLFAVMCGLLKRDANEEIKLTEAGHTLATIRPEIRADLAHFCIYTAYDPSEARSRTESWAYQQVVNSLWSHSPIEVLSTVNIVSEEVNNSAKELFGDNISFGSKSIRGVRKWLEALSPPVIEADIFTRRSFCLPELALLATAHIAQQTDASLGIDLLLTPARREAISRLCLLEPAALDRTFDWMLPLYPQIVTPGTTAGAYGRFIRFLRWPTMSDLLRR